MKGFVPWISVICLLVTACLPPDRDMRMVEVNGHEMRVQVSGLKNRSPGSPVVVLEAGFMGDGISAWRPVVKDISEFAPFIAYDRAGIGQSEPDGERPTPQHVAENLHSLLHVLDTEPPYVLVGHSLGGPFIRMFTALYPDEVAGLVYIDPTATVPEEVERAMNEAVGISTEDQQQLSDLLRERLSEMPTPGMRAEAEVVVELFEAHWPDYQTLPPMPDVPVSVIMADRFEAVPDDGIERSCEPRECHTRLMRFRREWLNSLAAEVTNGTLTVVTNSGHFIQQDDPDLVLWNIRRVLDPPEVRVPVDLGPDVLAEYVGNYRRGEEARIAVTLEDGQLLAQLTGQGAAAIYAESKDEFFYRVVDAQISFVRNGSGDVVELVLHQNGRNLSWERVAPEGPS